MPVRPFHPRVGLIIACTILWAGCLSEPFFWAKATGGNGDLGHDFVQAVGAVALIFGGATAWIELYSRLRWRRLTQPIAIDLLDQAIRHTGAITSQATYLLRGDDDLREAVDDLFRFPWSSARKEEIEAAARKLATTVEQFVFESTAARMEAVNRWKASRSELAMRADKLRSTALELHDYVEEKQVLALVRSVMWLHKRIRELADELPRFTSEPDHQAALLALLVGQIVEESVSVAQRIGDPYLQLRKGLKDTRLLSELVLEERLAKQGLSHRQQMRKADEWLETWERETDALIREHESRRFKDQERRQGACRRGERWLGGFCGSFGLIIGHSPDLRRTTILEPGGRPKSWLAAGAGVHAPRVPCVQLEPSLVRRTARGVSSVVSLCAVRASASLAEVL